MTEQGAPQTPPPLSPDGEVNQRLKKERDQAEHALAGGAGTGASKTNWFTASFAFLSDHVDIWRRFLGSVGFALLACAASGVFQWLKSLTGEQVTLPRAIIGASIAAFFVAGFRLIDRLTMRETLLMKIEEARLAAKLPTSTIEALVKPIADALSNRNKE